MQLLGGWQGEGTHCSRADRGHLATEVLDLRNWFMEAVQRREQAMGQAVLPLGLMASTFTGPCLQVRDWHACKRKHKRSSSIHCIGSGKGRERCRCKCS